MTIVPLSLQRNCSHRCRTSRKRRLSSICCKSQRAKPICCNWNVCCRMFTIWWWLTFWRRSEWLASFPYTTSMSYVASFDVWHVPCLQDGVWANSSLWAANLQQQELLGRVLSIDSENHWRRQLQGRAWDYERMPWQNPDVPAIDRTKQCAANAGGRGGDRAHLRPWRLSFAGLLHCQRDTKMHTAALENCQIDEWLCGGLPQYRTNGIYHRPLAHAADCRAFWLHRFVDQSVAARLDHAEVHVPRHFAVRCWAVAATNASAALRARAAVLKGHGVLHAESTETAQAALHRHRRAAGVARDVGNGTLRARATANERHGRIAEFHSLALGAYFIAADLFCALPIRQFSKHSDITTGKGELKLRNTYFSILLFLV